MRGKKRVLIAENDAEIRIANVSLVKSLDYEPISVVDGTEALQLIHTQKPFNLVISDLNMPGLDGLSLLRVLRDNPETAHIPFILYTAVSRDLIRFEEDGKTFYVKKGGPGLEEAIEAALSSRH